MEKLNLNKFKDNKLKSLKAVKGGAMAQSGHWGHPDGCIPGPTIVIK